MVKEQIFDSTEELHVLWYLNELKENGIVDSIIYHPTTYLLSEKVTVPSFSIGKRIEKEWQRFVFHSHEYTPDFLIKWTNNGLKIMCELDRYYKYHSGGYFELNNTKEEGICSIIDVKGVFVGKNNKAAVTFPLNQKWMFQRYGIIIQKIIPGTLFDQTFYPKRYMMNDDGRKMRMKKIAGKFVTLQSLGPTMYNSYLSNRINELKNNCVYDKFETVSAGVQRGT